jgi:uncharacterized protein YraI
MKDYLKTLRTTRAKVGALAIAFSLALSGCSGGGAKPTDVKITAPAPGTTINVGQGTVIQGEANGDNITRVEVVVDGKAYASLSTPDKTKGVPNFPVSVPWTPMAAGTHAIQLRAFGLEDKLMGQSEPLVMDAKPAVAQVTPTSAAAATKAPTAAAVATATPAAAAATATPAAQATTAAEGPSMTVTNDFVNVREGPNIGYRLLGRLDKGQTAPVRGKNQDGTWWQISYAAGSNGVGWVFGEYVQANAAAKNVPVASAPPLPTSPPQPTAAPSLPTAPPPTAGAVATPVPTGALVGAKGQLKLSQNPIPSGGSVNAYWSVSNISGIWFDSGDGGGFKAAGGTQTVNVTGITGQRTFQLKWKDNSGNETIDSIIVYISGQVVATSTNTPSNCNSTNPDWRGANANYPFCVAQDMDWTDGGSSVRKFGVGQDFTLSVRWNIYGIGGLWFLIEPNGDQCGPAGTSNVKVAVNGQGSYSWNVNTLAYGGYKVTMYVLRNDGVYARYNEKFICVGTGQTGPTNTPVPVTNTPVPATNTPVPVTNTPIPLPSPQP